jgi:hypothetical protein
MDAEEDEGDREGLDANGNGDDNMVFEEEGEGDYGTKRHLNLLTLLSLLTLLTLLSLLIHLANPPKPTDPADPTKLANPTHLRRGG